jgi:hypothetical protein
MPTGKGTVAVRSLQFKGDYSEQDAWEKSQPHSAYLQLQVEYEFQQILSFTKHSASKDPYERFEKRLIPMAFRLGRLLIALFLCLWEERTSVETTVRHGKEAYGRQPAKPRLLGTFFGKVRYWRTYVLQRNGRRGAGFYPVDLALGLTADGFGIGVLGRAVQLATKMSYAAAAFVMDSFLGWSPSIKTIEEATLGMGRFTAEWVERRPPKEGDGSVLVIQFDSKATPTARASELEKRRGKRKPNPFPDSPRHRGRYQRQKRGRKPRRKKGDKSKNGRMTTLVVMYTLKRDVYDDGQPLLKGPINRWVYASYAPKRHAFAMARREADKRGFDSKSGKVIQVMTDGDEDLEDYAIEYFPEAEHSLDVIHAVEYLWKAGACLYREGSYALRGWVEKQKDRLYAGEAAKIVRCLHASKQDARSASKRKTLDQIANYMEKRLHMMNYDQLERADMELSSGIVEGAVRYVVSQRFDEGGMRWIRERSEALLQLRCIEINGDWDGFINFIHAEIGRKQRSSRRAQRLLRDTPGPLPTLGIVR